MIPHISRRLIFVAFALIVAGSGLFAQRQYPGKPLFSPITDTAFIPVVELEVDALNNLEPKKSQGVSFKVDQFATPIEVAINTNHYGKWLHYDSEGKKIWLLRISAKQARSLHIIFDKFKLVAGAKLFLYSADMQIIKGAYTIENNKDWNSLAISPIEAAELYLELQVPENITNFGELEIGEIGVENKSKTLLKGTQDEYYGRSASCHVNVNCLVNGNYHRQKRSVCRIVYRGGRRCTGTLLNNLTNDGKPYILTAAHCFNSDLTAHNAVFLFNYDSPSCEGRDTLLPVEHSISGATVVSTTDNLDFVLLELSEKPIIEIEPYYSGWDARGIDPRSSYVLHHPQGDVKKITIDDDVPLTNSFSGFDPNTHWLLVNYELGTSEDGSSGSGLVSDEELLIGTLTGGGDTCAVNIYDYYQKFSHAYNDYSSPEEQLQHWLDPNGLNKLTCLPYDASKAFRESAQILTNINYDDTLKTHQQSNGWGYLSGHNYQGNSLFAEKFELRGSKYLYGANLHIAKQHGNEPYQQVIFTIWDGQSKPENIIYEKALPTANLDVSPYRFDFDSTILVHNGFFFGYRIAYNADTFALKTSACDYSNNTAYTFINNNWTALQKDGSEYPSKLALEVLAFDYLPNKGIIPDSNRISRVHVYPNPSSESFQVFFKDGINGIVEFKVYDLHGRLLIHQIETDPDANVHIHHLLPSGMYIMNIFVDEKEYEVKKLLVL